MALATALRGLGSCSGMTGRVYSVASRADVSRTLVGAKSLAQGCVGVRFEMRGGLVQGRCISGNLNYMFSE